MKCGCGVRATVVDGSDEGAGVVNVFVVILVVLVVCLLIVVSPGEQW